MAVTDGPNLGLAINALAGDVYDVPFRQFLRAIDALLQLAVISRTLAAPPGSPANGDRYIVAASPSGAWTGHAGSITAWTTDNPVTPAGLWEFYPPKFGWLSLCLADGLAYVYNGSAWVALGGGGGGSSTLAGDTDVVIASPTNGQVLTYDTSSSKWKNAAAVGGGGGGVPAGSNIVLIGGKSATDSGYAGLTIMKKIEANALLSLATAVKVVTALTSGTQTVGAAVLRTSVPGATVFDAGSTPITWGGSATPTLSAGNNVSDAITFTIDGTKDVWVIIYFSASSGDVMPTFDGYGTHEIWGYMSGNGTAVSSIPTLSASKAIVSAVRTA